MIALAMAAHAAVQGQAESYYNTKLDAGLWIDKAVHKLVAAGAYFIGWKLISFGFSVCKWIRIGPSALTLDLVVVSVEPPTGLLWAILRY